MANDGRGGPLLVRRGQHEKTSLREVFISAGMVRVNGCIDDVANWFLGNFANRGHYFLAIFWKPGIDQYDSFITDLGGDISTRARYEIHIAFHVQHLNCWRCSAVLRDRADYAKRREESDPGQVHWRGFDGTGSVASFCW